MWFEMKVREATHSREMSEEDLDFLTFGRPRLNSSASPQPLPDLVLPASPPHRRHRSASVNLPPDRDMLLSIGRNLRRMSDNFQPGEFQNENERSPTSGFPVVKHP